jgi:hypothetical protein
MKDRIWNVEGRVVKLRKAEVKNGQHYAISLDGKLQDTALRAAVGRRRAEALVQKIREGALM